MRRCCTVRPVMGPPGVMQDIPLKIAPHVADTAVCCIPTVIPTKKQRSLLGLCDEQFHHIPPCGWMPMQEILRRDPHPGRKGQVLRRNGEVSIRRELDGIAGKQCTVMVCQNASRNLAGAAILVADLIAVQPFRDSAHLQPQAGKQRRLILKADLFIYVFCPSGSLGDKPLLPVS